MINNSPIKIKRRYVHSFAKQFLEDHNIQMFAARRKILQPVGKLYEIKRPNTSFSIGVKIAELGEIKRINSFEELRSLGMTIISKQILGPERWRWNQKAIYELCKINDADDNLTMMPREHYIEYDTSNKTMRLIGINSGPRGFGPWISIDKKKEGLNSNKGIHDIYNLHKHTDSILKNSYLDLAMIKKQIEKVMIPEVACMITDSNEIVCFPDNLKDAPSILICGLKRSGKSYFLHSLVDRFFWKKNFSYKIGVLNDSSSEMQSWTLPNDDPKQIKTLNSIGEQPLPLPCVFLHPTNSEKYTKLLMGEVGFDISLKFKDLIKNHRKYLNLSESAKYFAKIEQKLMTCKTKEEVKNILDGMVLMHNIPTNSANKIHSAIDMWIENEMTDLTASYSQDWSTSKNPSKKYLPFSACLHAGVIPVIETAHISSDTTLLSTYVQYYAEDAFNQQIEDEDFINEQAEILLVADELHNLAEKGKNTPASRLLQRCVKEGGPRRVGTLFATQKFDKLENNIKDNTTFLFCFKNPAEASKIVNTYNMGKNVETTIKELGKHEFIAYTNDHFVVYDTNGNRRVSELNEVFKGRSLPTLSLHKAPKSKTTKDKTTREDDETDELDNETE